MLVIIHCEYPASQIIKDASEENYLRLREVFINLPESRLAPHTYIHAEHTDYLVDLTEHGKFLNDLGIKFHIKRFKGALWSGDKKPEYPPNQTITNIAIAIPNLALLEIREVMVLDDACTEDLQRELDEGWRILCVCPPSTQRRPDYILGRTQKQ